MRLLFFAAGIFLFPLSAQLHAELTIADIFTDGAVLQRDRPIPIWGTAGAGEKVTISFGTVKLKTLSDINGSWRTSLPALPASDQPRLLSISAGDETLIERNDILIGDVWLASGQSNMAMPVSRALNPEKELSEADYPMLRVFTVTRKSSPEPLDHCTGTWEKSSRETAGKFSATAWFFGREIHLEAGVPIGLIVSAWSGSAIEAWVSHEVQAEQSYLQPLLQSWADKDAAYTPAVAEEEETNHSEALAMWKKAFQTAKAADQPLPKKPRRPIDPRLHHHHPAALFNGMISPILPYAIRGAIWYQGETNGLTAESAALYDRQLPLLVNDWRRRWNQGDFPMAWIQLPFVSSQQVDWPTVREAMRLAQESLPNTGMAVTLDLGEERLLHPLNKQAFAHRLALWARSEVYGEDIPWSGPLPTNFKIKNGKATVTFSHANDGLVINGGESLTGFELRAKDGNWHPAKATISKNSILIVSTDVRAPIAIRYAWANHPAANLFNAAGLPATPFQLGDTANTVTQTTPKPTASKKATTNPPTKPPLDSAEIATLPFGGERVEIFLLMGQSNMKGRGIMPHEPLRDPRILMMHKKTDQWFLARHPLHLTGDPETFEGHDNAGVGSGLAFAETLVRHQPETRIALVPCAVGGTRIALWAKGSRLYEDAIRKAKLALEAGPKGKTRIAGALWLQGESDSQEARVPVYAEALAELVNNLRTDLEIEDLPFLVSTIGEMKADIGLRQAINEILLDLPNQVSGTAAVDARDLTGHIGDLVHLDTVSQNEIGKRFARKYLQLHQVRKEAK